MSALRLALSLAAPPMPRKEAAPPPKDEPRSPQTLLELALPVPFFS